jgi:hypothetical protein
MYPTVLPWPGGSSEVEPAWDGADSGARAVDGCAAVSSGLRESPEVAKVPVPTAGTSVDSRATNAVVGSLSVFPLLTWAYSEIGKTAASSKSTLPRADLIDNNF